MMGEIIKRFESKKNSVFLVSVEGIMQVVKVHESEEKAYFESEVLKRLYLYANVPKVIKVESNRIYMEYIEGKLAVDYFLECDTEEVKELARQMLSFAGFTQTNLITSVCRIQTSGILSWLKWTKKLNCTVLILRKGKKAH